MNTRLLSGFGMAVLLCACVAENQPQTEDSSSSALPTQSSAPQVLSSLSSSSSSTVVVTPSSSSSVAVIVPSSSSVQASSSSVSAPQSTSVTIQENDSAVCNYLGAIDDKHAGFTGNGFIDTENALGASISYGVEVQENANVSMTVRYANGGGSARGADVSINGGTGGSSAITLGDTGGWAAWRTETINIFLNAGKNTIALSANTANGLANIDSVAFSGAGLSAYECASLSVSSSSSSSASNSSSANVPVPPPSGQRPDPSMGGFANYPGYGLKTTTGGAGGTEVTVSNLSDLQRYAAMNEAYVIKVNGNISSPSYVKLKVGSNTTIIGQGRGARLSGIGFSLSGYTGEGACTTSTAGTYTPVSNVIIRNLEFTGLTGGSDPDAITIQCYTHHVWIDHNTFHAGDDGTVDFKRGSDLITVSYNHFIETDKTMLMGHSDNNAEQDTGRLRGTYHHNWMDKTTNRTPRVRFGYAHLYNNYMDVQNSVTRVDYNGQFYAEANFIRSQSKFTQEERGTGAHITLTSDNYLDLSNSTFKKHVDAKDKNFDVDNGASRPPYNYTLGPVPMSPPTNTGVGKI